MEQFVILSCHLRYLVHLAHLDSFELSKAAISKHILSGRIAIVRTLMGF